MSSIFEEIPNLKGVCRTFTAEICIAGQYEIAANYIQKHFKDNGGCVTIVPARYIYSGGQEDGIIVRFIHYPRFPISEINEAEEVILKKAKILGCELLKELGQKSFSIVCSGKTYWFSIVKDKEFG